MEACRMARLRAASGGDVDSLRMASSRSVFHSVTTSAFANAQPSDSVATRQARRRSFIGFAGCSTFGAGMQCLVLSRVGLQRILRRKAMKGFCFVARISLFVGNCPWSLDISKDALRVHRRSDGTLHIAH